MDQSAFLNISVWFGGRPLWWQCAGFMCDVSQRPNCKPVLGILSSPLGTAQSCRCASPTVTSCHLAFLRSESHEYENPSQLARLHVPATASTYLPQCFSIELTVVAKSRGTPCSNVWFSIVAARPTPTQEAQCLPPHAHTFWRSPALQQYQCRLAQLPKVSKLTSVGASWLNVGLNGSTA